MLYILWVLFVSVFLSGEEKGGRVPRGARGGHSRMRNHYLAGSRRPSTCFQSLTNILCNHSTNYLCTLPTI